MLIAQISPGPADFSKLKPQPFPTESILHFTGAFFGVWIGMLLVALLIAGVITLIILGFLKLSSKNKKKK